MNRLDSHLFTQLRGVLRTNEPMSLHTSWRVGGPADYFYQPVDQADIVALLKLLPPQEEIFWLGLGSNSLVRDGGIRGTVISTQKTLTSIEKNEPFKVRAEAGVSCATLARYCARENLAGVEFLAGIPGTVGGALAMNAGCHGGETWEHVAAVETVNRHGECFLRTPKEYEIGYRSVKGPLNEWFLAGHFLLKAGEKKKSLEEIRSLLDRRAKTQPTSEPNGGSVFRNPPGDYAARLIEACGLKGTSRGDACISEKHANFIVNRGKATGADIEALIAMMETQVESRFGIRLIAEVRVIGEAKAYEKTR